MPLASVIEHRGGERHLGAPDLGMARDRRIAVAVEHPQHLALGIGAWCATGSSIRDRCAGSANRARAFHRDDALPDRRQHFPRLRIHRRCGSASPTRSSPERAMISASAGRPRRHRQPLHARIVELAHAGVGGAAIVDHLDSGNSRRA
jgi:hypothetical protein